VKQLFEREEVAVETAAVKGASRSLWLASVMSLGYFKLRDAHGLVDDNVLAGFEGLAGNSKWLSLGVCHDDERERGVASIA